MTVGPGASAGPEAEETAESPVEIARSGIQSSALSDALCELDPYYCEFSMDIVRTSESASFVTVDYGWTDGDVACTERSDVRVFDDGTLEILSHDYEWDCGADVQQHPAYVARVTPSNTEIEQAICKSVPGTCSLLGVEELRAWAVAGGGFAADVAVMMKFDGAVCRFDIRIVKDLDFATRGAWGAPSSVTSQYERCTS